MFCPYMVKSRLEVLKSVQRMHRCAVRGRVSADEAREWARDEILREYSRVYDSSSFRV